jgi:hypothetical protein
MQILINIDVEFFYSSAETTNFTEVRDSDVSTNISRQAMGKRRKGRLSG